MDGVKSLVIELTGQQSPSISGCLSSKAMLFLAAKTVKRDWCVLIHLVSQMSVGLLLGKYD